MEKCQPVRDVIDIGHDNYENHHGRIGKFFPYTGLWQSLRKLIKGFNMSLLDKGMCPIPLDQKSDHYHLGLNIGYLKIYYSSYW